MEEWFIGWEDLRLCRCCFFTLKAIASVSSQDALCLWWLLIGATLIGASDRNFWGRPLDGERLFLFLSSGFLSQIQWSLLHFDIDPADIFSKNPKTNQLDATK